MRQGLTLVHALLLGLIVAPVLALMPGRGFAGDEPTPGPQAPSAPPAHLAPLADELIGTRVAPILLLSRPDVRADLALTAEQVRESEAISVELHARALALKGKSGPKFAAERKAIDERQRTWFETRLTPAQVRRLAEIDLQWEGRAALVTRPFIAHHLGLTGQQVSAMRQAVAARGAARLKGESPDVAERALAGQIDPLLDPNQGLRWRLMQGAPFVPQVAAKAGGTRAVR